MPKQIEIPVMEPPAVEAMEAAFTDAERTYWIGEHETFQILQSQWDITKAKALLKTSPREANAVPVTNLIALLHHIRTKQERIDRIEFAKSPPLIMGMVRGTYLLLDGYHRLSKAHTAGAEYMPVYVLTEAETNTIAIP